jgi:hypothetical protein
LTVSGRMSSTIVRDEHVTENWLNERIRNNHLQDFLAGRGMSWQSTGDAAASVVWLQFWLLICALNPVLRRVDAAFTRKQGFQSTITEVHSVYNGLCADMKPLAGVVTLDGVEDNPVGSVAVGSYYVTMGSLRHFLDGEMVSNDIIEQLEKLDAADGSMARIYAVSWAAGRFVLELIIRTELSAAERGKTTFYKPVPDCQPLAVKSLTSAPLRDIVVSHRCRVEKRVGGDAAGTKWKDTVFQ